MCLLTQEPKTQNKQTNKQKRNKSKNASFRFFIKYFDIATRTILFPFIHCPLQVSLGEYTSQILSPRLSLTPLQKIKIYIVWKVEESKNDNREDWHVSEITGSY